MLLMPLPDQAGTSWDCSNRQEDALPADAQYVPVAKADELQALLNRHRRIRLEPGGDYRHATGIKIFSGAALYGAAGTRIGRIIVSPGTTGAVLSGVIPESIDFPPSPLATHGNCFERFAARGFDQAPLTLRNAVVEDNLFLDVARIVIDTQASGHVSNNRFIRTMVHGEAPAIQISGNARASSERNIFLWTNLLGPMGDGIIVNHQAEVNFVGFDAENWNQRGLARFPAMMSVSDTGIVRTLMSHGGDPKTIPGRFMDISAQQFELIGMRLIRAGSPAILLRSGVTSFVNALSTDASITNEAPGLPTLSAFVGQSTEVALSAPDAGTAVLGRPVGGASPWPAARFAPIPDPAGTEWRAARAGAVDSREMIQRMIDAQGVVLLPAGTFFVSGSLRLKNGQGLVGAGAARTVIVAQTPDIDLIVGDDHYADNHPTSFALVDLTLQGGRAGIRHDEHGAGKGAQYNLCYISHVVFRDMTEAGIVIVGIYGWDNNLLDNVTFYRMPVGILQIPSAWYVNATVTGDVAGMNYMDKNVCYRCRFDTLGRGMELTAKRANGLNACIDCRFENNSNGAMRLVNNLSTVIANCDFINNGGDPEIDSNFPVGVAGSRFSVGVREHALLGDGQICEDCSFKSSSARRVTIGASKARLVLMNSRAEGVPLGEGISGLLVQTVITDSPSLRAQIVALSAGQATVLASGPPEPRPQLLVSWHD